jgi:hypothetical protein
LARRARRAPSLPPLRLDYAEFARVQRTPDPERLASALAYWRPLLAAYPGRIVWSSHDLAVPQAESTTITRFTFLPRALERVRTLSAGARVPPFVTLLSAAGLALARVTGQRRIFTGSNTANREDPRKVDLIGYFTNTRFAMIETAGGASLAPLIPGIRHVWLDSDEYCREIYSSELLAALGSPRAAKINLLDFPDGSDGRRLGPFSGIPELDGIVVTRIPVEREVFHWREFELTWSQSGGRLAAEVWHRGLDPALIAALEVELREILEQD